MNQFVKSFFESYCVSIQSCLQGIYNFLVALAVVVAFIFFLIGAFEYLLSTIPDVKLQGKNRMGSAIKGLIIIFVSGVILYWINPYIFNAKIMIFRITKLQVPILTLEEKSTTTSITISYGGSQIPMQIPMADLDLDKFKDKECASSSITARITFYYTPVSTNDVFKGMLHKFLSLTTLEGSSIISVNGNLKVLNSTKAKKIIIDTKIHGYQKCGGGFAWTWPTNESIYNKGSYCKGKWVQPDQRSINYGRDEDFIYVTDAEEAIKKEAVPVTDLTKLTGAYGPLIPFKTGAIDDNNSLFKKYQIIKFLDCGGCALEGQSIVITDSGQLDNNQIDIYAGVDEKALQKASVYRPKYQRRVGNRTIYEAIVCIVGQASLKKK